MEIVPCSPTPASIPDPSSIAWADRLAGRIANALVTIGHVTRHDLALASTHAERTGMPLVEAVVELGFLGEAEAFAVLAEVTGLPLVSLGDVSADRLALQLVPERVARRHRLLPLREDDRTLTYATARPFDDEAERDLAFVCGRQPNAVLARPSELIEAIDRHYPRLGEFERLVARLEGVGPKAIVDADGEAESESPVVTLCNRLIVGAVDARASDIHVEPAAHGLLVRYRVGGILDPVLTLPLDSARLIVNRFKVMAKADIAMRQRPQDGAFRLAISGRPVDVRLSTLPTVHGEKIVMRVIDSHSEVRTIDGLGYAPGTRQRLDRALRRPDGLVLVTGPTGSGKTTVLYAALEALRTGRTNLVSVEDPVERRVEGVNQIAINARAGNGFASVLRSVLRQDPDVIMVGEIRDAEVAQIVGQAAYTGHLVLSSLHTSDAATAITRLRNLGLEPFRIAESLTAVVAQRLVRRLCPHCLIRLDPRAARAAGEARGIATVTARSGPGCPECRHTGYVERVPVAEILVPDDELRAAIASGASAADIRAAMQAAHLPTLREAAVALVEQGVTSLDEIDRVVADDTPHGAGRRSQRPRVLIADDDPIIRMLVRMLLDQAGLDVVEAADSLQAVEVARRERPQLAILDLTMPGLDGFGAIDRIRRDLSLTDMAITVLTAEQGPGIQQRVLELGADDYLVKPFEAPVLLARVRAALRRVDRTAA